MGAVAAGASVSGARVLAVAAVSAQVLPCVARPVSDGEPCVPAPVLALLQSYKADASNIRTNSTHDRRLIIGKGCFRKGPEVFSVMKGEDAAIGQAYAHASGPVEPKVWLYQLAPAAPLANTHICECAGPPPPKCQRNECQGNQKRKPCAPIPLTNIPLTTRPEPATPLANTHNCQCAGPTPKECQRNGCQGNQKLKPCVPILLTNIPLTSARPK